VAKYERLTFCYEAGPTGYELYWQLKSVGHECVVVAPSLIPKKPGDRVKTDRRDAVSLAKLLRAGELTAVWVPDRHHEAMRDLTRAREATVMDLRSKRQQVSAFLLRQGLHYAGKKTWSKAHVSWLTSQKLNYLEQRLAFEEMMLADAPGARTSCTTGAGDPSGDARSDTSARGDRYGSALMVPRRDMPSARPAFETARDRQSRRGMSWPR
jgi:transposase